MKNVAYGTLEKARRFEMQKNSLSYMILKSVKYIMYISMILVFFYLLKDTFYNPNIILIDKEGIRYIPAKSKSDLKSRPH